MREHEWIYVGHVWDLGCTKLKNIAMIRNFNNDGSPGNSGYNGVNDL